MALSLPPLSAAQQSILNTQIQKSCLYPVTFSANRIYGAVNYTGASSFLLGGSSGVANTNAKFLQLTYTPNVTSGLTAVNWQGFFFKNNTADFVHTSFGAQVSYSSKFIDNNVALSVDLGNIIYWNEFAYEFDSDFGPFGRQFLRYQDCTSFSPYNYFLQANIPIYIYLYVRTQTLYQNVLTTEQSVTLYLMQTASKS